ncbi:platelet endothelial cell adhesion molecule [Trichomycterus rosablanca]|uniref:platelet endothelial cell adhesion molecule n=1 Tax=Trichomycterus rosablanca TaxID=2290929 RepID=UPI002F3564CE
MTVRCRKECRELYIGETKQPLAKRLLIKGVTLSVEPENKVERGSNLKLTCNAEVSHASHAAPTYKYSFYKDFGEDALHTEETNASKPGLYYINEARASHSGMYKCKVLVEGLSMESSTEDIIVEGGIMTPVLIVNKSQVTEGENVSAICKAEEESGSLTFSLKNGLKEIYREETTNGEVHRTLSFTSRGTARLTCSYFINLESGRLKSNDSNVFSITVLELDITSRIVVKPSTEVTEGDTINISCTEGQINQNLRSVSLQLVKGSKILKPDMKNSEYSKVVTAEDSGKYECFSVMNNIQKTDSANLTIKELFSQPILTITPAEVFEKQQFTVTCRSSDYASERIRPNEITYSIYRNNLKLISGSINGMYKGVAGAETNGNYSCVAQVSVINKTSHQKSFKAKVLVSKPIIKVVGSVILGNPFQIECHSQNGSLPITYTLKKASEVQGQKKVSGPSERARFTALLYSENEINDFRCEAQNNGLHSVHLSESLTAQVTVPVGRPLLTIAPDPNDITENQNVFLICSIGKGTPPISFKWYHNGSSSPIHSATVMANTSSYMLRSVSSVDSGRYHCEALNSDQEQISNQVYMAVRMAHWKIGLIVGLIIIVCLLCLAGLLIRYKAKRVGMATTNGAGIWSERPPVSDSIEAVDVDRPEEPNVEYTEVLHPQTDPTRVPLRKNTDTVYSEVQTSPQGSDKEF